MYFFGFIFLQRDVTSSFCRSPMEATGSIETATNAPVRARSVDRVSFAGLPIAILVLVDEDEEEECSEWP